MTSQQFTIGIEEEYMILDPQTRELKSHQNKIIEQAEKILQKDKVKAEMHQAVVEVGTSICNNIEEARSDVRLLRKTISELAQSEGLRCGASGTHPFSLWYKQSITENPRYHEIVNEMQDAARSNLIFGLHVHIGIQSREMAIHIANSVRYFLPHIYALSTNSPFWEGRNTGFKSYRSKVFDKFPRTGIPDFFESIEEYDNYIKVLIKTNCIDNAKKIWWDIRVHPSYNTIEFRICDILLTTDETIAIAALFQAICVKLYRLRMQNMNYIIYKRFYINENKWRASRYGIDGLLIDFGKETEVPVKSLILELLDFIDDVIDDLGSRDAINTVFKILKSGTGADKQLAIFEKTKKLTDVVDFICDEFLK
ncbi:carboxylate-amine ligase [Arachidicoccus soli]|uniref:Putative glutamate--cysteine ligase 2 n=1 Tax=Arachidicoccus soli TaxID=2341117 RepID=A0A386HLI2_9BACT|nr:carboxylate-amine ligase [Arachidicoccus soli]AYD46522.1 carboxylate-amine ligase [Arachidicoccus soli]